MKITDLKEAELKILKEWEYSESYKIIKQLVDSIEVEDAKYLSLVTMDKPNEWELVKEVFRRTFTAKGARLIVKLPIKATKLLKEINEK